MSALRRLFHLLTPALLTLSIAATAAADDRNVAQAPASWLDLRRQQPITGDAQAGKALSTVCAACHGTDGFSVAPNFPSLAGQSATYLYVQLKTFKQGQRPDPVMSGLVSALSDADLRNLSAWYASLPPNPAGQPDATSRGGQLFLDGDPARGIPPCQGCHGPTGRGPRNATTDAPHPPWTTVPRLHGQPATYVAKTLHDFRSGARGGTSNAEIMHGVTKTLSDEDIKALATYIESQ